MKNNQVRKNTGIKSHLIKIGGMQCSFCVESIRKAYSRMDGVSDIAINLSHEEALIHFNPESISETDLNDTMRSMGYTVRDPNKILTLEEEQRELQTHGNQLLIASAITTVTLLFMVLKWVGYGQNWFKWIMLGLTLLMIFKVGWSILRMASASISRKIFNQHVLMEFGAFGGLIGGLIGFFIKDWPMADFFGAAIFIVTYHILSGYVSLRVRTKSSRAITQLMNLQPPTARVVQEGIGIEVGIEEVKLGDIVRVIPGESIPVDGIIIDGVSTVDQSLVTGEPIPEFKSKGDEVIGGSINQYGKLDIKVTKIGEESFLIQVVKSIQEARALKPGILQTVEKVLRYFIPGVLIAAFLAFSFWSLGSWIIFGEANFRRAIFSALAVLVMGYPCALGMATPLSIIRGGGLAAEKGIIMRSGEAFQIFKDISIIALDKTGTITVGKPKVVDIMYLDNTSEEKLLSLALAVEVNSEHPVAKAIVDFTKKTKTISYEVENFQSISGFGVKAVVDNNIILIGSPRFISSEKIGLSVIQEKLDEMEEKGWTVIVVSENFKILGLIAVADTIKEDAIETIRQMKKYGLEPVLITGDNKNAGNYIASKVGIYKVMTEVIPQEKAEIIRELQENGTRVAMVGDGINDAPALMQADIGIAFNAGTDIAIEAADIILVNNNLSGVIDSYHIAKNSFRKTKQNVVFAFAFNGIGVPLAMTGLLNPIFAMIAMATSVSTVLTNSYGGKILPSNSNRKSESSILTYFIPTIHCIGCVNNLVNAIENIPGVNSIVGDPTDKTITIDMQSKTHIKKINKAIESKNHIIQEIIN